MAQSMKNIRTQPRKSKKTNDWVCCLCNNLNFSFRTLCNRCHMQSKEKNDLQISLVRHHSQNYINLYYHATPVQKHYDQSTCVTSNDSLKEQEPQLLRLTGLKHDGYARALFLSPCRSQCSSKVNSPYRSPKCEVDLVPLLGLMRLRGQI